jgi:hypothetical protein
LPPALGCASLIAATGVVIGAPIWAAEPSESRRSTKRWLAGFHRDRDLGVTVFIAMLL